MNKETSHDVVLQSYRRMVQQQLLHETHPEQGQVEWIWQDGTNDRIREPQEADSVQHLSHLIWGMNEQMKVLKQQLARLPSSDPHVPLIHQMLQELSDTAHGLYQQGEDVQTTLDRTVYEPVVLDRLYQYQKAQRMLPEIQAQLIQLQSDEYVHPLSVTAKYGEQIGGGGGLPSSPVEMAVNRRIEDIHQKNQEYARYQKEIFEMEQALAEIDEQDRNMIEYFFLQPASSKMSGEAKAKHMNVHRSTLYRMREKAVDALARVLQII